MSEDGLSTINPDGFSKANRKDVGVLKAAGMNTIKVDNRPFLIEIKANEMRKLVWLIRELSVWKHINWWEATDIPSCMKQDFHYAPLEKTSCIFNKEGRLRKMILSSVINELSHRIPAYSQIRQHGRIFKSRRSENSPGFNINDRMNPLT
ncbi:Uncharacterized protein DAT39_002894 [Clarias magur]|uniref:Uncharacterized protein n=1 Tax=Clarias magur TaxID=1594786 RepID=A0A8J4UZW3_CLAMG|nr:Uncharacterized protein DAT39_002894 [Clarias magur]